MGIKLYGVALSTAAQRSLVCLYEKEVDFEFVVVDMKSGEHKKEHFLAKNPFGQVPAMEDGDVTMFESRAINQYVVHSYMDKGTQFVFPEDKKKMAAIGSWMEVESTKFDPHASKLLFQLVFKQMYGMGPADEAAVAQHEGELCKVLDVYEARLSKCDYLSGDVFGLADLHHLPTLSLIMTTESKKIVEARPNVSKWAADILARPAWAKVLALKNN